MKKFSMATAVMSVFVVMFGLAGQASASTWHSSGGAISGTATTATFLTITSGSSRVVLSCTSSTASGTLSATTGPTTATWPGAATLTPAFSGCRSAGVDYVVACNDNGTGFPTRTDPAAGLASLNAAVFNRGVVVANQAASVGLSTTGTLTGIFCDVGLRAGTNWCKRIASTTSILTGGSVQGTYTNPTRIGGTDGSLDISASGQSLGVYTSTKGGTCAALLNGTATFTGPLGPPVADAVYGNSSAFIWQTNP